MIRCSKAVLLLAAGSLLLPTGPVLAQSGARPAAAPRTYDLAFVDADVRAVVDAVLGSMMGVDYAVDGDVEGKITLRTSRPVSAGALLPMLERALQSVGAVITVQGGGYRVMKRSAARASAPTIASVASAASDPAAPVTAGFASEIVTLSQGSARPVARLLQQFLGEAVVVGIDPAYNQITIAGSGTERATARAMIARLDVDALAKMRFEMYKLDNADPDSLLADLEQIFQPPLDIIGSRVRFIPLPRLRSLLGIAANPADLSRVEPWIRQLDAGGASYKRKLYSYSVQNGRARDLAASLQRVLGAGGDSQGADVIPLPSDQRSALGGFGAASGSGLSIAGGLGQGRSGGDPLASLTLGAEPDQAIANQTPLPGESSRLSTSSMAAAGGSGARIVPNEANNSLLIYANGEDYAFIREALEKLDQPVSQVLIEATLAEVTLDNDLNFGLEWSFGSGGSSFTLSNHAGGTPSPSFPGFSYGYVGSNSRLVLNALQSRTNVKVLSAPKLIVLNNQTATLQVGDQVPIITQQAQGVSAPGAPIVNSVELRDTGIILKVTPRVNDSGNVILDIAQEVSDVAETTSSGINSPTIQQRRLASTVSTRSGQMIALGGLIRDRTTIGRSGIPLLSQIPIIGGAFGTQRRGGSRTELIILLTPTVMRSPEETKATVDELLERLDDTAPLVESASGRQVGGNGARP